MNNGYYGQKQITGQSPETYRWVDRKPRQRPPMRREAVETGRAKRRLNDRDTAIINNVLMYALLICVVVVLFMEITKLSEITALNKEINALKRDNAAIRASVENSEVELGLEKRTDVIKQKAEEQLGMFMPEAGEIASLKGVKRSTKEATQTAENLLNGR